MKQLMSPSHRGPSAGPAIGQSPMALGRHEQSASRPAIPPGAEPGRGQSSGLASPGEGLGQQAQRGLQGRPTDPSDEGLA